VPSSLSFQENKIKKKKSKIRKIEEKKIKIVSIQMSMTPSHLLNIQKKNRLDKIQEVGKNS